jgi:hypothetical protein
VTVAIDGINPNDNAQSLNIGGEVAFFNDMFILSGGFSELFLEDREKGLSMGVGFNTKIAGGFGLRTGYAYQNFEHLANVNRFSIAVTF